MGFKWRHRERLFLTAASDNANIQYKLPTIGSIPYRKGVLNKKMTYRTCTLMILLRFKKQNANETTGVSDIQTSPFNS